MIILLKSCFTSYVTIILCTKDEENIENHITTKDKNLSSTEAKNESALTCSLDDSQYIETDSLSLSVIEVPEKVRNRRRSTFSLQTKQLRSFQSNHLSHMIVNSPSTKKFNDKSFNQFFLLSASIEDILAQMDGLSSIEPLSRASFYKPVRVIDRYPLTPPASTSLLTSQEVASFCFPPSGVKFRFIPKCAKDLAMGKGLIGKEGDRYQLHTVSTANIIFT